MPSVSVGKSIRFYDSVIKVWCVNHQFSCRVILKSLKAIFTASLLGAQHEGDDTEKRLASLLLSLGKVLIGAHLYLCDGHVVEPSSLPDGVAQSDKRFANRACAHMQIM